MQIERVNILIKIKKFYIEELNYIILVYYHMKEQKVKLLYYQHLLQLVKRIQLQEHGQEEEMKEKSIKIHLNFLLYFILQMFLNKIIGYLME